jgi:hypothetical protein
VVRPGHTTPILETIKYLPFAEGLVDPIQRTTRGEIEASVTDELIGLLQGGEFTVRGDPEAIIDSCMDSRDREVGVKAAGGTTSLVMMDSLTTDSYRQPGDKAPTHKAKMVAELKKSGLPVGGHTAENAATPNDGGCGGEDKMDAPDDEIPQKKSALRLLTQEGKAVFGFMRSLGYEVEPELEQQTMDKAQALRDEGYATTGKELSEAGNVPRKVLPGDQKAVVVAIMTKPGECLDQPAIARAFGPDYQVFEVEAWAIANSATAISLSAKEQHAKNIAGAAYNFATAGVIVGEGMPFVIL